MRIPGDQKQLLLLAKQIVERCKVSQGQRLSQCREIARYIENGTNNDEQSLANKLYSYTDRISSYLFCPTDARFTVDYEQKYSKFTLQQAEQVARIVTRQFNLKNFDLTFAEGVTESLRYGASIGKITGKTESCDIGGRPYQRLKSASARIIPPWMMGVENEGKNGLENQEAILETVYLSEYDVWRRIKNFDDAEKIFKRIMSYAASSEGQPMPSAFIQLLSASALDINPGGSNPPAPGGMVQTGGTGTFVGPQVLGKQIEMSELWVWDDDAGESGDWLMIQVIEPDILVSPRYKRVNEFCEGLNPYILIQPNVQSGYLWGRSEVYDIIPLQGCLSETMVDIRRLMGLQYDGRYSFTGFDGDSQEMADDFRSAGWVGGRPGAEVKDLTPKLPTEAIPYVKLIEGQMEDISGFSNILSGQGEAGVRAGNHANTLMKTASPRLRDRSLIVERQFAQMGDVFLHYLEDKDDTPYHTDPDKVEETQFFLAQIPDDRRVLVDSHSSSPIYENDHLQLTAFALKAELIDGARAISMLNLPDKDEAIREWRERAIAKQKLIQEHPELLTKGTRSHK